MWNCWDAEFFSQCKMFRLLRKEKKKKGTNVGVWGELHIERGSIVWLIRKWVQSMCFGSIFTCFGGISIENWNLALCLGITSLQSERQALIWSETHQLSAFAHSNTAQQLKAGHTNTTSHGNSSVVEPFWAARINKQYSGFYKKRKLFSRLYSFWEELVLFYPKNSGIHLCYKNSREIWMVARCKHHESPFWSCLPRHFFPMHRFDRIEI